MQQTSIPTMTTSIITVGALLSLCQHLHASYLLLRMMVLEQDARSSPERRSFQLPEFKKGVRFRERLTPSKDPTIRDTAVCLNIKHPRNVPFRCPMSGR